MNNKIWKVLSYVLVAALASAISMALVAGEVVKRDTKLFELSQLIEERFIEDVDMAKAEDAAAAAMVDSLGDKWSYYLTADEYVAHMEQMNNAYVGIGVTISGTEDGTAVEVLKVEPNGPAAEAGVEPGDVVVAVFGQRVEGMTANDVSLLVKGEAGTTVDPLRR